MNFYDLMLAESIGGSGGGGGSATLIEKSISANGVYKASDDSADGYSKATVNVPNSYVAGDEGKVVSNGALVSQSSVTYDSNGTYDTTLKNSVTVNVQPPQEVEINDVTLIDYDGTALYSYTKEEFLALESLPPNPSHNGLVAQGWNWTLQQAKDYVTANEYLCIGQNYNTADGKTHIIIEVPENATNMDFFIGMSTSVKNGVTIDWGDENTEVTDSTGHKFYSHQYTNAGEYEIKISNTSGTYQFANNASNSGMFWNNTTGARSTACFVKKIYIGSGCVYINRNMLGYASNVSEISFPTSITGFANGGGGSAFTDAWELKCVVLPPNSNLYSGNNFPSSINLRFISFGYGCSLNGSPNSNLKGLKMLTTPSLSSLTYTIGSGLYNLERFCVAGDYTAISGAFLQSSAPQNKVVIPSTVTSISANVCQNTIIKNLYMKPTTPPTLANTNAFTTYSGMKIYVPYSADHSVLDAYQTATNWSSFASYMVEESA